MNSRDSASTFAKGLRVLQCFEQVRSDLTMAEIARSTGFDRATARRLCLTLEDEGYLARTGRALRLTPRIMALAGGYLGAQEIGKSVQPVLNHFAEDLKDEIALAVLDGTRAIYVARSAVASARLSIGFSIGSTLPLLPTAVGRMLLAQCDPARRDALMQGCELRRYTERTDMDPGSIRDKVEAAAKQGYALVSAEFEAGAAGIAVPAPRLAGTPAVLAASATVNRLDQPGELDRILDVLRKAAMGLRG